MKGSSGKWQVLFPAAEIDNGRNHVDKGSLSRFLRATKDSSISMSMLASSGCSSCSLASLNRISRS